MIDLFFSTSFSNIYNLYDLVFVIFLLISLYFGSKNGLMRVVLQVCGRLITIFGAGFLAHFCAPILADAVVVPILGDVFHRQLSSLPITSNLQLQISQTTSSLAEGVAFFILFLLFTIGLTVVIRGVDSALQFAKRFPPLGFLDRVGGGALGIVSGSVLALVLLHLAYYLQPALFAPLGIFATDKLAQTALVSRLLAIFPIS